MGLLQTWMAKIDLASHSFELSKLSKLLKVFSALLWLSKAPYVHQYVQYGDSNDVHCSMQLPTTHTPRLHRLLYARRQTDEPHAAVVQVTDHRRIVSRTASQTAAISSLVLHVAHHSSFGKLTQRKNGCRC